MSGKKITGLTDIAWTFGGCWALSIAGSRVHISVYGPLTRISDGSSRGCSRHSSTLMETSG